MRKVFEESYMLQPWEKFSAASGMAEFASNDNSYEMVFKRADKAMYAEKQEFKKIHGIKDSR